MNRPVGLQRWTSVLTASVAGFGIAVSSALLAVLVLGWLQWRKPPTWLELAVIVLVIGGGLVLAGRVAVDVAGTLAPAAAVGVTALVGLIGALASQAGESHGDGLEMNQIVEAMAFVLVFTGSATLVVGRRRRRG